MGNPFSGISGNTETVETPQGNPRVLYDPRTDLKKDSELWVQVMTRLLDSRSELAYILHGMRCQGCELTQGKSTYKIVPVIGPHGWPSKEAYASAAEKYLAPFREDLIKAFKIEEKPISDLPPGVTVLPSPWPGLTGGFVYVVDSEDARKAFKALAKEGWTFFKDELAAMRRERDPIMCLQWRGQHGCFLGSEKHCEENRKEWFGVDQVSEAKKADTP